MQETILAWLAVIVILFIYFIPSMVGGRAKERSAAIFTLNLLLGWTFFGWVIALVWAIAEKKNEV